MEEIYVKRQHDRVCSRLSPHLLSLLLLSMFALNACSTPFGGSTKVILKFAPTATPFPMPVITVTMKQQGVIQLQAFQQWINLLKQNGGNSSQYDRQYTSDQQALQNATTLADYKSALNALNAQVQTIEMPAMKTEATNLHQKLQQQAMAWGQQHTYYNAYDQKTYNLGFEYTAIGIGSWSQDDIDGSASVSDYQQAIENLQVYMTNFQAMTANATDPTPYNQPHRTDLQLMQHYNRMNDSVLVVSLQEQAMRVYNHGQLVNSFLVTTGMPDRPTPPGNWWIESKQTNTTFKSGVQPGQPGYYPPTPIDYAMQYHSEGYFIHDSWWRNDYGPHKNFPHIDSSGDSFAFEGSHGCVNMSKVDSAWIYNFVSLFTGLIIY